MKKILIPIALFAVIFSKAQVHESPNGNVGISIANPTSKLHVYGGASGKAPHGFADLAIEDDEAGMVSILTPNTQNAYYGFADTDDDFVGGIQYNHTNDIMYFRVNNHASDMVINKNGNIGVGTTNPTQEVDVNGEVQSKGFVLVDPSLGSNTDYTVLYRDDLGPDNATVKLRIGDDTLGSFHIGYLYWSTGEWISRFYVNNNGRVGIGTTSPDAKLAVRGNIHAQEVKVDLNGAVAPDYVFKEGYDLRSLQEVQDHIKEHGHLPNIPSAQEMEANGIDLGQMNLKLLEKIEELTLYTLKQEEEIQELKTQNSKMAKLEKENKKIIVLEDRLSKIEELLN